MATRTDTVCPVCANKSWQTSYDAGNTWECAVCLATFVDDDPASGHPAMQNGES
jgi:ribosomal protein L37AE/L43A